MNEVAFEKKEDDGEDDENIDSNIEWSNLIFLPFHSGFKLMVLFSVLIKSVLGPIQSVYPIVYCLDVMDQNMCLSFVKYFYWYCCDTIYGVDTFLHIVHRQVTEKAMRREYLPKSAFYLLLDIVSLIPFYRLVEENICPPTAIWPNILAFTEFVVIYRVVDHFSLESTHSFWHIVIGFTLLLASCLNCITCFWLLLTKYGLCKSCSGSNIYYDWRHYIFHKLNETDENYTNYVYSSAYVLSFAINRSFDETKPSTIWEFYMICFLMICGYVFTLFVVLPKLFAEAILTLCRIFTNYPHVQRIVQDTRRRNSSVTANVRVENFYKLIWKKRSGVIYLPEVMAELPRYLRLDICQDLVWPVFYHSPTLRKTTIPFKRWICDFMKLDYKLPGENFFTGPHCYTNIYYIKSGIVQLMSEDDGVTPVLSVTGGTVFGDINFFISPTDRKVVVRCLTYCEVFSVSRYHMIRGMHKFPGDRRIILESAQNRIEHAKALYRCKQDVKGLNRAEVEGISWIKKRWWQISEVISNWKKTFRKERYKYEIPPEETNYHCAKYIGQLVLCRDAQLQTKSIFANVNFPWIFAPNSSFVTIWRKIVILTVSLVLMLYPPHITSLSIPMPFRFFQFWTDLVYTGDICVSLLTSLQNQDNIRESFASVVFARCKTLYFFLDVLSTIWIENLVLLFGMPDLYYLVQFNRLIKIYILFTGELVRWDIRNNPMHIVGYKIIIINFSAVYIMSYVFYMLSTRIPGITFSHFFGKKHCGLDIPKSQCAERIEEKIDIAIAWTFERMFLEYFPRKLIDIYLSMISLYTSFMVYMFCKTLLIAAIYLQFRGIVNYKYFVTNLKKYYKYYNIHPDLLRRLNRYLNCHWKYYHGADVMNPDFLKNEPFDIFWKVQGEVAEKILSQSKAFAGAHPGLIRELAYYAKFLILPKNSAIVLFGVQIKNASWIVKGHIKCEFHSENGELLKTYHKPGQLLSMSSVFLKNVSLRTYIACTDCEILYIKLQDFHKILKRYPTEWTYFKNCIDEFSPGFDKIYQSYLKKHRDYQKKLRERIFHSRMSLIAPITKEPMSSPVTPTIYNVDAWPAPDFQFLEFWMLFRATIVFVSIAAAALQGGSGVLYRWPLILTCAFCDCIAWTDIIIKLSLPYYDEKGILIYDKLKCVKHYLSRGFLLDIIGVLPWFQIAGSLLENETDENDAMLINTMCRFAHLYILFGYFDYLGDKPNINSAFITIVKWQVILVLVMLGGSHFLMSYCVAFTFDANSRFELLDIKRRGTCWMPAFFKLSRNITVEQLHLVYIESLSLVQCGFTRMNFGRFIINRVYIGVGTSLLFLALLHWYVMCYSLALLISNSRGHTMFQNGVRQLERFLEAERVDKNLIYKTVRHFRYWWIRTKGINIHYLTNERIGVVFRQDLSYYFLKRTLVALNSILQGGESLERQLASASTQIYFLPNEMIVREMDLNSSIYVVHRGKVVISQGGKKITTLTKGCIFGQLTDDVSRPIKISASAESHADLLQISNKQFQDFITDEVRDTISNNPQSKDDFIATSKNVTDNPYDTVQYILRGRKSIKLPWMAKPMEAHHSSWYVKWLYLAWVVAPTTSVAMVLILDTLPQNFIGKHIWGLILSDLVYFANFIAEFYTMELQVVQNKCVKRKIGFGVFRTWGFYIDATTLVLPLLTLVSNNWNYQLIRFLRLRQFYYFHNSFCRSFKSKAAPMILKTTIVLLLFHAMTCGWIHVACRGCARVTKNYKPERFKMPSFVVPKDWHNDYIIALTFILLIHTRTTYDAVIALSPSQVLYKVIINYFIFIIDMWLISVAMGATYTKFRELYQYDYNVGNLITCLQHRGLSPTLLESVKEYTKQLWRRQRGNWLPELAGQAPVCLREDLMEALYMHHLTAPPLFQKLPQYFRRQLVSRLQRIVIFPGKCIVQEGDIHSCIYFIHEGEVEKRYVDKKGESKMLSLLSANGYFGLIPGMFPNVSFSFSYYSRTVVDLVFLKFNDWQDLLEGYPDIKHELYTAATQLKSEVK
uniref:Cyclic nucleotide-binding domain-containing protein n=1 Tax=Bombyx mori TaxID=7091 RepID=A0A8R2QVW1_BOMMO|nr:uncharacterized protein LOC101743360 isoform X2 [Bombyx mori]